MRCEANILPKIVGNFRAMAMLVRVVGFHAVAGLREGKIEGIFAACTRNSGFAVNNYLGIYMVF